ncbi:hypothetical protein V6O07_16395, partial [Arthrospira platensis SPKY2]
MSDPEIYRRLDNLEETDKQLSKTVADLVLDIRLMVQSMNTMQRTIERLADVDDKYNTRMKKLEDCNADQHHKLDIRLTNVENGNNIDRKST